MHELLNGEMIEFENSEGYKEVISRRASSQEGTRVNIYLCVLVCGWVGLWMFDCDESGKLSGYRVRDVAS